MKVFKNVVARGRDWSVAGALALLAAVVYFTGLIDYAFPGEQAALLSAWAGLEPLPTNNFPLMTWFCRTFGFGQSIAPVCGVLGVLVLYHIVLFFFRERIGGEYSEEDAVVTSRLAGLVAALVFLFTPAVRTAATRLDARLFDAVWALLSFALIIAYVRLPRRVAWLAVVAAGMMAGFGVVDTATFLCLAPLYILAVWIASRKRGGKGYGTASLFLTAFLGTGIIAVCAAYSGFGAFADSQKAILNIWFKSDGSFVVPLFTTLPFIIALFSSGRAFGSDRGLVQVSFHALMTLVSILALATPLSASAIMGPLQYSPIVVSVFAAFTAGYLMAYWWGLTRPRVYSDGSRQDTKASETARQTGWIGGGVFALILALTMVFDFFMVTDDGRGRFADQVADRIVADLGGRTWFVTDGTLDSHLRLAARKAGKELNLICLQKENDKEYVESLAALLEAKDMGGYCDRLRKYGILTFIQDWFASDPEVMKKVAVFGAPDLWNLAPGVRAIPELFFFGGDPERLVAGYDDRRAFAKILSAPEGWGSYQMGLKEKDSLNLRRLNLRRHLGFVTCDLGCFEQAEGRRLQNVGIEAEAMVHYDRAFDAYDFVLRELDADNISALFNEYELLNRGNKKAELRRKDIISTLEAIKKDENRRYIYSVLPLVYGYLMNERLIMELGLAQVKGGSFGQGISQIRRAIDLVPVEQRDWAELTILAPLYAEGRGANKEEARKIYMRELEKDPKSRLALLGLARLAMMSGENDKAIELLEQATADAADDPRAYVDIATLRLLRDELDEAHRILQRAVDLQHSNIRAWALMAATVARQLDALSLISDEAAREVRRKELEDELEKTILPTMAKLDANHPTVRSTRALAKIRKGGRENLEEARNELLLIAAANPENAGTGDMILDLDIRLNDKENAQLRAADVLRVDPRAPLANYVMGSLALGNGDLPTAERHLRLSVETQNPVPLAINDLAELLRQKKDYVEAERMARLATTKIPGLYVVWETLGTILLDGGKDDNLAEAERCIQTACNMSRDKAGNPQDPRMLISLARIQIKLGKITEAKKNLRIVNSRISELEPADRQQFEKVVKLAQ